MIKNIETEYKGIMFRSRLEARWAVFFDELQIQYQYEVEGFDIEGTWYVPDFYLPDYSCWEEIKPNGYKWWEDEKIKAFSKQVDKKFILVSGAPQKEKYKVYILANSDWNEADEEFKNNFLENRGEFALAIRATGNELCFLGDVEDGGISFNLIDNSTDDGEREPITMGMENAYKKAMNMKFF